LKHKGAHALKEREELAVIVGGASQKSASEPMSRKQERAKIKPTSRKQERAKVKGL
jgi:hypothetical protein